MIKEYRTHLYWRWQQMLGRCYNKNNRKYSRYGGRGITVSKEWFMYDNFKRDMEKGFKRELSLDRIDNNEGYYKENCRWATPREQSINTIRHEKAKRYTFNGMTKTIMEWAKLTGIKRPTLNARLSIYGWSIEQALREKAYYGRHNKDRRLSSQT